MGIEIVRVPLGADVADHVAKLVGEAARGAIPFAPAPVIYLAPSERRGRTISRLAGEEFPKGTPDYVARELLKLCAPQIRLRGEVERVFDFFAALTDTLTELGENRRAGRPLVDELIEAWKRIAQTIPPDLRDTASLNTWLPAIGRRGELLGGVIKRYIGKLEELGQHDPEDALWLAAKHADVSPALLIVDDVDHVTPARRRLIEALDARSTRTQLILRGNRDSLRHIAPAHEIAQEIMFDADGRVAEEQAWAQRPLGPLCESWLEDASCRADIEVLRPATRSGEVREAARLVKLAVRDGVRLSDICVGMPSTSSYRELIEEVFGASGVPYDAPFELPLDEVAPVAALLDLLRACIGGLSRNELLDALGSPFLPFKAKDPSAFRASLEEVTRAAWVTGGGDIDRDWLGKLDSKRPDDWASIREDTVGVLEALAPFTRRQMTGAAFVSAVEALLEAAGMKQVVEADRRSAGTGAAIRSEALHRFVILLRELRQGFKEDDGHKLPLRELLRVLLEQARSHSVRPPETGGERVRVLGLRELRGMSYQRLILIGLTDRDLPLSPLDTMFLPASREELLAAVLDKHRARELCAPIDVTAQADYLFAHALLAGGGEVTLMLPANEGDTPCVPATPLARMLRSIGRHKLEDLSASRVGELPTSPGDLAAQVATGLALIERTGAQPTSKLKLDQPALKVGLAGRCLELARSDMSAAPGEFEGVIEPLPKLGEMFAPTGDDRHVFSASQLDSYVECPQRFWARYILRTKQPEEPTLDTKPSAVGTLLHATFERWALLLRKRVGQPEVLSEPAKREPVSLLELGGDAAAARAIGLEIMNQAFEDACRTEPNEGPFWEGVKNLVAAGLPGREDDGLGTGLLARFVDFELTRNAEGHAIRFAEFDFGLGDEPRPDRPDVIADTLELPIPGGTLSLKGSVDRVDESEAGLEILDYKTGQTKTGADIRDGKAFQLAAYLSAISQLAGTPPKGMGYMRVPPEGNIEALDVTQYNRKPAYDVHELVFEKLPERLARILQAMRGGVFMHLPFAPPQKACNYCDYAVACAKREDVIAERQARLADAETPEVAAVYLPDVEGK